MMKKEMFFGAKTKLAQFKMSFAMSLLGLVLMAGPARAQKASNTPQDDADKIKAKVTGINDDKVHVIDSSIRVFPDNGFYKVLYIQEWDFANSPTADMPGADDKMHVVQIDLYNTALNKLKIPVDLIAIDYLGRVEQFPDFLADYFSPYLVLEIRAHHSTLFCAFDTTGTCIGFAEQSLVKLKQRVEVNQHIRDAKYKPKKLTKKEQNLMNTELQHVR